MQKISFVLRGFIALAVNFGWFFVLLDDRIDNLFPFWPYPLAFIMAWFTHGILYGIFPGPTALKETKRVKNMGATLEPGADSPRKLAAGYWIMFLLFEICWIGLVIIQHIRYAGMWQLHQK